MGVQQPPVPATNLTLISRLSFCAGEAGENAPLVVCAQNGRLMEGRFVPLCISIHDNPRTAPALSRKLTNFAKLRL
jgi:hypothetical protein